MALAYLTLIVLTLFSISDIRDREIKIYLFLLAATWLLAVGLLLHSWTFLPPYLGRSLFLLLLATLAQKLGAWHYGEVLIMPVIAAGLHTVPAVLFLAALTTVFPLSIAVTEQAAEWNGTPGLPALTATYTAALLLSLTL